MKRVLPFTAGALICIAGGEFGILTYTLLERGEFFTTLLAAGFALVGLIVGGFFIGKSLEIVVQPEENQ
jgi:hypothetical protein